MIIEVWSDFHCPFCYIGKRRLEEALAKFPQKDQVEVVFKSYQLNPQAAAYSGQDYYESLGDRFGDVNQVKQMLNGIVKQAESVGLTFNFATMKPTNTLAAHRLTHFAQTKGKGALLTEKLLAASFTESKDIGHNDVLVDLATEVGLDRAEALAVLEDHDAYKEAVNNEINEAKQLGVTGVPYFIFNRKYAVSGAQSPDVFNQVLEKVWQESQVAPVIETISPESEADGVCGDDGCDI